MYRSDKCRRCDRTCRSSPIKCTECGLACYCRAKCRAEDQWRHEADCQVAKLIGNCSGCGAVRVGMQQCGNCQEALYCGGQCQKKDWPRHKPECLKTSQGIIHLAGELNQRPRVVPSNPLRLYYWGNMPAFDLINLSLNEGSGYASPLALLLCGVGDPRNVARTLASLPKSYEEHVTFVLNDISPCTLARTVLLLYMVLEGGQEEAKTVTQVWYSLRIGEHSHRFLASALERLIQAPSLDELTRGVLTAFEEHFAILKGVWQKWLRLSSTPASQPWITAGRVKTFKQDPEVSEGLANYLREIPSEHKASAEKWFGDGILLPKVHSHGELKHENVTLAGSVFWPLDDFEYCVPSDGLPFTSWDYKDAKAFRTVPSLQEMYSEYVSYVLVKCARRLTSGRVKLYCILSNCTQMQDFLPSGLTFDRITTSNLCDFIPLPTLLSMCRPLLNQANPNSVIVTETHNWLYRFPEMQMRMEIDCCFKVHAERAARDTGNRLIGNSTCRTSFVEYYVFEAEFQRFLRASLLSAELKDSPPRKHIPPLKALAQKHGLILRDFLRNGNRICPFRWPINCRRVTQLNGFERTVEWILPSAKPPSKQ